MTPSERFKLFLKSQGISYSMLSETIGMSVANVSKYIGVGDRKSKFGKKYVSILKSKYGLNPEWYENGIGDMLISENDIAFPDENLKFEIITAEDLVQIPMIESAFPCGMPEMNNGNILKVSIKKDFVIGIKDPYMLNCKGTSMSPIIEEGDIAIVDTLNGDYSRVSDRDIVVAYINNEFTIKRIFHSNGYFMLVPENLLKHKPILINKTDEFSIIGLVKKIIRPV